MINRYQKLFEKSNKLVIVDVQPHDVGKWIHWNMHEFANFVNTYSDVLVLYNGDDLGWETEDEMRYYYEEIGIDTNLTFVEKGYAFFRDFMDAVGSDHSDIAKVVKFMHDKHIRDIRDLSDDQFEYVSKILGIEGKSPDDYSLWIPDFIDDLQHYKGADIVGGGKNECLAEVMIVNEAFHFNLKLINKWVY